jgi:hypothetical protein
MAKVKIPSKATYFKSETVSSTEMFEKLIKAVNFIASFIGCHTMSPHFSFKNFMLIALFVDLVTYLAISFQNIYAFRDDFERQIFCVATLGMGFQGAIKLYTFVFNRENILKLAELAENFHKSSNDVKAVKSFEKWMLTFCHVGSLFAVAYFGCGFLVFCYPMIFYLIFGKKILHFGFVIPGTDSETLIGYSVNFAHQTFQIYVVIIAVSVTSFYTIFFILNVFAQYDSIEVELDNLSELATKHEKDKQKFKIKNQKIKEKIGKITDEHVKLFE